jgi:hypothetical protein
MTEPKNLAASLIAIVFTIALVIAIQRIRRR